MTSNTTDFPIQAEYKLTRRGMGSITKLEKRKATIACRKWRLTVSLGKDPLTGKYRRKTRTFHGTYGQAMEALRSFNDEVRAGR